MKKTVYSIISIAICAVLAAIFLWASSYRKALPVKTAEVTLSSLSNSISTNGKIEAEKIHEIHAPFAGVCRNILAKAGDRLSQGQPILMLDDNSIRSELAAARAELAAARSDFQNIHRGPTKEEVDQADAEIARLQLEGEGVQKNLETNEWLLKRDAVSRLEVEQNRREEARLAQALGAARTRRDNLLSRYTASDKKRASARVEAAEARIQVLEANIARSVIRAPVAGTLYRFEAKDGAYLNPGDLIGLFADLTRLRVRAFVDEPELGETAVGAEMAAHWDAYPDETWKGKVLFIPSEVVTRGTRSVAEVLCGIESPPHGLVPNVNVDVEITTAAGRRVPAIPRTALFAEGKSRYVWLMQGDQSLRRPVEVGQSNALLVEVRGGISVGQRVIIPGEASLAEGMKVREADK
jgi:multidrug efflux pump subunit AcrA (membrane-fusion protein)